MSSDWIIILIIYIIGIIITSIIAGIIDNDHDIFDKGILAIAWPLPATFLIFVGIVGIFGLPSKLGPFIAKMIENHKNSCSKAEKCAKCPNYQTCDNSVTVILSNEKEVNYG